MADAYYLTEEDLVKIRQIAEQVLGARKNSPSRYRLGEEESQSPDVYVARTPMGGISPLNENTLTGTGSLTDDSPGSAVCDIYRLTAVGSIFELHPVHLTRRVYNISTLSVAGGKWVVIFRDKFGTWYLPSPPAGFSGCRLESNAFSPSAFITVSGSVSQAIDWSTTFGSDTFTTEDSYRRLGIKPTALFAPFTGYYIVGGSVGLSAGLPLGIECHLSIRKNDPTDVYPTKAVAKMGSYIDDTAQGTVGTVLPMNANDYIELVLSFNFSTGGPITPQTVYLYFASFWMTKTG